MVVTWIKPAGLIIDHIYSLGFWKKENHSTGFFLDRHELELDNGHLDSIGTSITASILQLT
jgi:hypothetical protein